MPTPDNDPDQEKKRQELEPDIWRRVAFASGLFLGDVTVRTLLESLPVGCIILDGSGTILLVNNRTEQMFGYAKEELMGKPHAVFLPERFRTVHEEHMARFFAEPAAIPMPHSLDVTALRRDESEFPVSIDLGSIETGNGVHFLAFVSDITIRKQFERRLRESEELFHLQTEQVRDYAIFTIDPQGIVLNWNAGAERLKGYRAEEIIGRHFSCFYSEEARNAGKPEANIKKAADEGQVADEGWRIRKDGSRFWAEVIITALHDENGNLLGFSKVTHDITERKQAEKALKQIEWMLSKMPPSPAGFDVSDSQGYGDLTMLNRVGLIARSVDKRTLQGLVSEYLDLLGTSSAIYEKNGDYAFGIFASGWCRLMDRASRKLCHTDDNASALASGKWLCHESCWTCCSIHAIETRGPVDIECNGGIRLYAVPIFVGEEVIGAINFGYGDPPKDLEKLRSIADSYELDYEELLREARAYNTRPPFIIEMAKERLQVSANFIGMLVELKRNEEALRENELRLVSIYNTVGDSIFHLAVEPEGQFRFISVNPAFLRVTGLRSEAVVGKTVNEVIPEPSLTMFLEKNRQSIKEHALVRWEEVADYPAGRLTAEVSIAPVFDDKGKCAHLVGAAHDITERKRTEEVLYRLNRELQAICSCNQVMVRSQDEQSLISEICRIICDEAGYRMAWVGYAENDDAKTIRPGAWAGFEDGYLVEADITWADGERGRNPSGTAVRTGKTVCNLDFSTNPIAPWCDSALQRGYHSSIALPLEDESGNNFGVLSIYAALPNAFPPDEIRLLEELSGDLAFGVTALRARAARKQAEEALRLSAAIMETVAEGIVLIGVDDNIIKWTNYKCEKMFGYGCGEMVGMHVDNVNAPTEKTPTETRISIVDVLLADGEWHGEIKSIKKDGTHFWCKIHVSLFDHPEYGKVMVDAHTDITERKLVEEALRESEQKYRQLNETLEQRINEAVEDLHEKNKMLIIQGRQAVMGEMIGNISHQWRQPLNMLGLIAQELPVIYKQGEFNAEYLDAKVRKIMEMIQQMSKTIDDFRNFFQTDKVMVNFNVHEVIEKTMSLLEAGLKASGIRIEIEVTDDISINAYPNEFAQVLLNIVNNARDALLERNADKPAITIRSWIEGGKVVVTVSDNAGGIPEGIMGKVFDPYFTTKGPDKGTGIGLYMSKSIIEEHMNGRLSVRNAGDGAEFRIEI